MYKEKRTGPRTEPWGTLLRRRKGQLYELQIRTFERRFEREDRIHLTKQGGRSKERSLERRAECQTESKAFAKSTVAKTVRAPGLDWWKESAIDCERRT